jgi:hypothetical protein
MALIDLDESFDFGNASRQHYESFTPQVGSLPEMVSDQGHRGDPDESG